jgi:hypothetical protein
MKARAMEKTLFPVLAAVLLTGAAALSVAEEKEDFSQLIYDPFPTGHFDFEQDPAFSMIVQELKYWIVNSRLDKEMYDTSRVNNWNHFCAIGYVFPDDPDETPEEHIEKEVIVYWKEKKIFKRWHGDDPEAVEESFYYAHSLMFSRGFSLEDTIERKVWESGQILFLGTGTHIKEDLDNLITDCEKHGKQYTIKPFTPPAKNF